MAALPLSQRGLDLNLPSETRSDAAVVPPETIVLEYSAEREIAINHQPVLLAELEARLRDIFASRRDKTLYIMGSGALRYGDIVEVIDAGKGAGVDRVGVITETMRNRAGR